MIFAIFIILISQWIRKLSHLYVAFRWQFFLQIHILTNIRDRIILLTLEALMTYELLSIFIGRGKNHKVSKSNTQNETNHVYGFIRPPLIWQRQVVSNAKMVRHFPFFKALRVSEKS